MFPETVTWNGEEYEVPSFEEIQAWVYCGAAKTVTGYTVEPDGYGPDDSPSWLIILGLI